VWGDGWYIGVRCPLRNLQNVLWSKVYRFVRSSTSARIATALLLLAGLMSAPTLAAPPSAPAGTPTGPLPPSEVGLWIDDTGKGAIEISPCGRKLCGRIVWLQEPLDKNGKPLIDRLNPTAGQRSKPVCGLQVLGNLERQSDGTWDNGWVYDPKVGESFDLAVEMRGPGQLVVTGYKGLKLFSKKFVWTRAGGALPPCAPRA
jgi:uncharacterized protein (DUF2147 family)